jgi:hypothetical protein
MPFQVSPGVNVSEIDLTTIVPAVSTTEGAIAGIFRWGPVEEAHLVTTEDELVLLYGRPCSNNYETFYTAANFLAYGNKLYVSRAAAANSFNSYALQSGTTATANVQVKNNDDYLTKTFDTSNTTFISKYPGVLGNSLKLSVCDSANAYSSTFSSGNATFTANISLSVNSNTMLVAVSGAGSNTNCNTVATAMAAKLTVGDYVYVGNTTLGYQYVQVASVDSGGTLDTTNSNTTFSNTYFNVSLKGPFTLAANVYNTSYTRYWEFYNIVSGAPGTSVSAQQAGGSGDELHIVVVDEDGQFSNGSNNQVLEVWNNLSRAKNSKAEQGGALWYKDVINRSSRYIWTTGDRSSSPTSNVASVTAVNTLPYTVSMSGGNDGVTETTVALSSMTAAYDKFKSAEDINVSLILTGKSQYGVYGEGLANYLIDNIAEYRKDCVVFCSPKLENVVNNPNNELNNVVTFRNALRSTSYAFLDSGYKYQYDKYHDQYVWVPLNGDVAGTVVRTDNLRDPWFSPAGFNRGQIKNVVKLAYNPNKGNRDVLYQAGVNPVVNFPGQGVILYGDKTLLAKPSAFDRINVRRLFIVLEKAIAIAARYSLFELNDEYTRAQFRNLVEPYLRDVKGRRGIYDFRVICDTTNNTPERIDRNEFWGDIYIKPARSINFIQLNFIAVRTGVAFDEIVGKF